MTTRTLIASINTTAVGELQEVSGLWSFQYARSWLDDPQRYALSPHLPLQNPAIADGATLRPVQWFFDNLLPEEGQRTLLAKDAKVPSGDAFGLLAYYGAESAGALTLLPPDSEQPPASGTRPLRNDELSARIKALPHAPLGHNAAKRMSLAGAQHKLPVVIDHEALFEPIGNQPSTHILKPDHPDEDYPHSVINEWFSMRLAQRLGLDVPDVQHRYVPEPIYLIERFDRQQQQPGQWQRLHAIDACQLLNLDRSFKYAQGSIDNLAAMANACRAPAVARARLFSWLVFNILIGNSDAHLKNLSFLVSPAGIAPSPHYDLLAVAVYDSLAYNKPGWPQQTTLAWPILGTERFAEVTSDLLVAAAGGMGIQPNTARRLIAAQRERIVASAEAIYQDLETHDNVTAAETRCARAIIHTVIRPMVAQLA